MKTTCVTRPVWLILAAAFFLPTLALADEGKDAGVYQSNRLASPEAPSRTSWAPIRYALAFENRTTWLQDSAAKRMLGKRTSTEGGLSLHYDAIEVLDGTTLDLDLGWLTMKASPTLDYSAETEQLKRNILSLGVSLRRHLWSWLAPYARMAGGLGWDNLQVGAGDSTLHDTRRFGEATFGAGLYLRTMGWQIRPLPALGIIARVEGGYALGSETAFSLKSNLPASGSNRVPTSPVPAGSIARNAPYLRVMVGIGF
jgi:hypothetical protein